MVIIFILGLGTGSVDVGRGRKDPAPAMIPPGCCFDAIATLATGEFSANRLISTLRGAGQWQGPIYVITDHTEMYRGKAVVNEYSATVHTGAYAVEIRATEPFWLPDEARSRWEEHKSFSKRIWTKWHKTQIFQMLPKDINTILLMDADVEVKGPIHRFESDIAHHLMPHRCNASFFQERWYSRGTMGAFNSGIAIYTREGSRDLLAEWSRQILSTTFVRDQLALNAAMENTTSTICKLPSRHLFYVADTVQRWKNKLPFFSAKEPITFAHMTGQKSLERMATGEYHV